MNYILRIYGVSFLKISAFLISYSTPQSWSQHQATAVFFPPVPCLYGLNKSCLNFQYLWFLVWNSWHYEQSVYGLSAAVWVSVCQPKLSWTTARGEQQLLQPCEWCSRIPSCCAVSLLWAQTENAPAPHSTACFPCTAPQCFSCHCP